MTRGLTLRISTRIGIVLGIFSLILVAISMAALYATSHANSVIHEIYNDDMAGAGDIALIQLGVSRQRLALDRAVLAVGTPEATERLSTLGTRQKQMDEAWKHFQSLPRDAQEEKLTNEFGAATGALRQAVEGLAAAVRAGEQARLLELMRDLTQRYEVMSVKAEALKKYQSEYAAQRYARSDRTYSMFMMAAFGAAAFAILVAIWSYIALRRAIVRPIDSVLAHLGYIAAGDLGQRIPRHANDELGQVLEGLDGMRRQLADTVGEVRASSASISAATRDIASGQLDLSSRTEEQAASLEQTAASMGELTGIVKQNADNAHLASTLAEKARATAQQGSDVMGRMTDTMGTIDQSSQHIGDIVTLIETISFQTNILALNAAVEAARAGEEGRGFAVVASEVRALAQRSATAAKEIKTLISTSTERVRLGMSLVDEAGTTMRGIITAVQQVSDIMGEIAAASVEQSGGIEQVNKAVMQMDEMTQHNAALVEQSTAAAQSLHEQADRLDRAISAFKTAQVTAPALSAARPLVLAAA
ncbi:Methyl-accepting chemotaxis protein [Bordetella sputigena]|uniref:methyl-accepting chemotaxis protein n=1 Tax=Bordetella sputigena TaxID=1416810 RepID=UPI0039F14158